MKTLFTEIKNYGLKIGLGNSLILFTQWFVGAKKIKLTY